MRSDSTHSSHPKNILLSSSPSLCFDFYIFIHKQIYFFQERSNLLKTLWQLSSKSLHGNIIIWLYYKQMSKSRSKKSKNSPIPMFIAKLLQIVENQQIVDIVSWTTTRDSFNIKNISRFTEEILPRYFKHHNFASFIRQLNMYGFKKIRHPDGDNVYINENFKQGSRHLLPNIVRKMREEKDEELDLYSQTHNAPESGRVGKQIQQLRSKQKNLEDMCKRFLVQNQKLLEENQSLVKKMEKDSREKQKRLQEFLIYLLAQKNARALTGAEVTQLSLTNSQAPVTQIKPEIINPDVTPLEVLGNNMDQNEGFRKMKMMLQNAYNHHRARRRERNFTIIPHKQEEEAHGNQADPLSEINPLQNEESELISQIPVANSHRQEDNKSFLSINDFINAEEYQDFNLEQSN